MENEVLIQNEKHLKDKIHIIRGMEVMLDFELAEIYGYETKDFNRQVKNNIEKFDDDFRFQLTDKEVKEFSRWKISTLNDNSSVRGHNIKYNPYAFTEQDVHMLMTVLKGDLATQQSKALIRMFKKMKDCIIENQQFVSQRDFLRLSMQTSDNTRDMIELTCQLREIDDKIEDVVSNLGEMVRKSELSPFMMNLGKKEIPAGWLILNGQSALQIEGEREVSKREKSR